MKTPATLPRKCLAALAGTVLISLSAACAAEEQPTEQLDPDTQTVDEIIEQADKVHPATLYQLAGQLMAQGRRDEAVKWFYVGQLRYRFLLAANPSARAKDEPLFASLSESVGRPVNEYAFGDVDAAVKEIDAALAWDAANPNAITPKDGHAAELAELRAGLQKMRDDMVAQKDLIRETRTRNGLENR
ncbi:hypothetical protein GRI97_09950 [Altererythrobacter xixiisoli]|uniref:Tetratricopeptide repeat protein n=1 Tax=Croceibacterium xixiisoli TaxID=1476466 RepID=A0A6I4TW16_9SPHN|nr:hypothetical protein [Croceibacterium xixiisoli]MXO99311.1 hypothetical protein [Croceibacterium xixiisoli]